MRRLFLLGAALLLLAAPACGDDDDDTATDAGGDEAGEVTTLEVTATEFAFEHAATVQAGPVRIDAANEGQQEHVAIVQRIGGGKTFDEIKTTLADPEAEADVTTAFGVGSLDAGTSNNATGVLTPGNYVLICPLPDAADGAPHFSKGMLSSLVVEAGGDDGSLPEADVTITGREFTFEDVPAELEEGDLTIQFENAGEQEHELTLVELEDGKTVDDMVAFLQAPPGEGGAPPMRRLGGALIGAGVREPAVSTYRIESGKRYAFACFVPDFAETPPKPHVVNGMRTGELEVS